MSLEKLLRHREQINALSRTILQGRPAFEDVHVLLPDPKNPESAFIKATSWLYCLYFEAGKASVRFLQRCGIACSLIAHEDGEQHLNVVQCLRTELHHNLGFQDADYKRRNTACTWRRMTCGTAVPESDDEWRKCYNRLICDATTFLEQGLMVVRHIETSGEYAEEWLRRVARDRPAASFDPLVEDAKIRLGYVALDTVKFRNRHYDRWRQQLELNDDSYDFEYEATRLIEKSLLSEDSSVPPLTGKDIMNILDIPAGAQVGEILRKMKNHWESSKCTREALLDYLRQEYSVDKDG